MPGSNQVGMAVRPVALNTLKLNSNYGETQAKNRLTWNHARSKSTWHGCTTGSNKYSEIKQQLQRNTSKNAVNIEPCQVQINLAWLRAGGKGGCPPNLHACPPSLPQITKLTLLTTATFVLNFTFWHPPDECLPLLCRLFWCRVWHGCTSGSIQHVNYVLQLYTKTRKQNYG